LNTPDIHHFLIKKYFNCVPVTVEDEPNFTAKELEGYFKLIPKDIPGFVCIQTNFRDNPHLPERIVRQYEAHGERDPETGVVNSLHYYLNQIQGYCTTGLKGQIFKNYDIISLDDYLALPYHEIYGVDFGTASPAGIVSVKIHKNEVWVRELNYEPVDLISMGKKLDRLGIGRNDLVICDIAGEHFIRELRGGLKRLFSDEERLLYPQASNGFRNLVGSPDKRIESGIEKLLSMKIHVTSDSLNLQKELMMYVWDTDRDGKALDKPVKAYDHLLDPLRYIVVGHRAW
jgi:phage terminase large subunit